MDERSADETDGGTSRTRERRLAGGFGTLYAGSDGEWYTSWEVLINHRTGRWEPCLSHEDGRRLVAVGDELLLLEPSAVDDLPDWIEIRVTPRSPGVDRHRPRTRAVDTRSVGR